MAPTLSNLVARQFGNGNNNNDGPFNDRNGSNSGISKWAIIGIVIALAILGLLIPLIIFRYMRRRRRAAVVSAINLTSTTPHKPASAPTASTDPTKYAGGMGGYTATPDQNHSLLGHAEAPAIVTWDPSHGDNLASTQDGFGYDNNLHLAAGIQRPASVATFSAPPPRYEEATGSSSNLRPQSQGEAASYFNAGVSMGEERGRSRSRDPPAEGTRGRALSVDTRSVNGDRRRSISRFREEGMVDVNVDKR